MKKYLLALAVSALALQSTFADWVIVQKSVTDGQTQEITMKIKGDKARADIGVQMSMIVDSATQETVMLMHAQKAMMKMNADSMKSMMAVAGGLLGGGEPPAKPVATGQMEKIGEHNCEIFTWSGKMGTGKFWIAKDFPDAKVLNEIQDKIMKSMGNPQASFAPQASDFPGVPVKSEMTMMGKTVVSELVSVKKDTVDATVFILPADYQEMKMPAAPAKP